MFNLLFIIEKKYICVILKVGVSMKKGCKIIILVFISLIFVLLSLFLFYKLYPTLNKEKLVELKEYYVASNKPTTDIFVLNKERNMMESSKDIIRGTKIISDNKIISINDVKYLEILEGENKYYIKEENAVEEIKKIVLEKEKYVRTSVTVYQNEKDSKIESFIKKSNKIEIIDFDKIDESGNVNMYKIKKDNIEGWVYSKYLVDTESELENPKEYDIHKDRKYSFELYGGNTSTLDYYPFAKPNFKENPILENGKTLYLNAGTNVISNIDNYINLATSSGINSMVVDIKDGLLAYPVSVAQNYSPTAYNNAINNFETYKTAIDKIKQAGIYVIGRIVVFNDSQYASDHPEECIQYTSWVSAYSRKAWEYNVELAKQAIKDVGFNEIQFDYVRFPESSYIYSKNGYDFKNVYNEEKAEAIQNFLIYAADQIHKEKVYLAADVFGECSDTYVTAYGQYWPAISNVVDVISSMPYTDHFGRNVDTWSNPYKTILDWAKETSIRQSEIPTPAIARTWITAYDTPYWNPTVYYNADKISDQIKALSDAGLKGGFITWNASSNIYKYNQIKDAFSKNY